jgi:ATP-dependent DNA ligase
MLRMRALPAGFIAPCLPTKADTLPSNGLWIHEIKHDGFRRQRALIEKAIQQGRSTEVAETTLEALEASHRLFERQRRLLLDRLQERER